MINFSLPTLLMLLLSQYFAIQGHLMVCMKVLCWQKPFI